MSNPTEEKLYAIRSVALSKPGADESDAARALYNAGRASRDAEVDELRAALSHICEHFSDRPDTGACCHAALDRGRRALRLTAEKGAGNE